MSSLPGDQQFLNDLGKFLSQIMIFIRKSSPKSTVFLARIIDGYLTIGYYSNYSYCADYYRGYSDKNNYPNNAYPEIYDYVQDHKYLIEDLKKYIDNDYPTSKRKIKNIYYRSTKNNNDETFAIGPAQMKSIGKLNNCYYSRFTPKTSSNTYNNIPTDQWQ